MRRPLRRLPAFLTLVTILLVTPAVGARDSAAAVHDDIQLRTFPSPWELVPRDDDGAATVSIAGQMVGAAWDAVELEILRDGRPWRVLRHPLVANASGGPNFDFAPRLPAGLVDYRLILHLVSGGRRVVAADSDHVVVGDIYLIQGQSNAVAADYHFERLANAELQRPWIRSFGTASTNPTDVANDLVWYLADGEGSNASGTVGSWGLRMAQLLSEAFGVPIGLLNGAVGGTPISYNLRNDSDPEDLATNYGRLLFRARQAGLADEARGMIWYQGESDAGNYRGWTESFVDLYADWLADYPSLERIYLFQLRNSCGLPTLDVQSIQRLLPDHLPGVSVLATTAAPGHDFCHFFYVGYRELGTQLARLMARDLYGLEDPGNIESPNLDRAFFSTPERDEVTLVMRKTTDSLIFDRGAEADFGLGDGAQVVSGEVVGSTLVLQLDRASDATSIWYEGHGNDGPSITNARGNGMLVFKVTLKAAPLR